MQRVLPRMKTLYRAEARFLASVFVVASLLLSFGFIADQVMEGSTAAFDRYVVLAFRDGPGALSRPIGPPWMQEAARDFTSLGSFAVLGVVTFAAVAYLLFTGARATALLVLVAVVGGATINSLLKMQFERPRPDLFVPAAKVFTASFPSGHAALSAVTYLTLAALLGRTTDSRRLRYYYMSVAFALMCLVGASRVYLGVHYPTDVLAGWCFGSAWALLCWAVMTRLQKTHRIEPPNT